MKTIPDGFLSEDHHELLQLLNEHEVKYLLIGGVAVAYHGFVRATHDVDIFYSPNKENARRIFTSLDLFFDGLTPELGSYEKFIEPETIFRFGNPPNQVEFLNEIDGVSFEEAWENRVIVSGTSSQNDIPIIDLKRLLKNKEASPRTKDKADFEQLQQVLENDEDQA